MPGAAAVPPRGSCAGLRACAFVGGTDGLAHNPEVAGSNPAPATQNAQVRTLIIIKALTAFKIIPDPFQKFSPPQRRCVSAGGTDRRGLALPADPPDSRTPDIGTG